MLLKGHGESLERWPPALTEAAAQSHGETPYHPPQPEPTCTHRACRGRACRGRACRTEAQGPGPRSGMLRPALERSLHPPLVFLGANSCPSPKRLGS